MPVSGDAREITRRERELLVGLVAGLGIRGSADRLVITMATTRTHIKHLHMKTQTHSLDQLVAWAYQHPGAWKVAPTTPNFGDDDERAPE